MKKSIAILTILLGLGISSFATDSISRRERRKARKAKTEMSQKECKTVCTQEQQKSCCKK
jgi:hypothetical protein